VLNFGSAQNVPNQVVVKTGTGGKVTVYAGGATNVIVDVVGYFTSADFNKFTPVASPTRITAVTVPALGTVDVQVLGAGGIPLTGPANRSIEAVVLNIGAVNPTAAGHLRVWTSGLTMPNASTNNFGKGDSRSNLTIVSPGNTTSASMGKVSIYNGSGGPLTLTVDTVGYFTLGGQVLVPISPARLLDTRIGSAVPAGGYVEASVRGFSGIPDSADVTAVVVNVASVNPAAAGSVDVGKSGANPALPSFFHPAGQNVANLVITQVGADGKIRIVNNSPGTTHVIADITGYFTN